MSHNVLSLVRASNCDRPRGGAGARSVNRGSWIRAHSVCSSLRTTAAPGREMAARRACSGGGDTTLARPLATVAAALLLCAFVGVADGSDAPRAGQHRVHPVADTPTHDPMKGDSDSVAYFPSAHRHRRANQRTPARNVPARCHGRVRKRGSTLIK